MDEHDARGAEAGMPGHGARVNDVVFGGVLVAAGLLLFGLHRDIFGVLSLWPLVPIGIGLSKVLGGCCAHSRREGFWFLALGLWFALNQFTLLSYHDTWPLLLVAAGGLITWGAVSPHAPCALCGEDRHVK